MSDILVYNNWDPLEEIWLGDVYPENFYDDLEPKIRDNFCTITEWTKQDLKAIEKKFEEFGVTVHRPNIKDKDKFIDKKIGKLVKPPICPRDDNVVIGNKLYYSTDFGGVYTELSQQYNSKNVSVQPDMLLSGASIVKLGQDLIFDFNIFTTNLNLADRKNTLFSHFYQFNKVIDEYKKDYRIHYSTNGGHCDACFMPIKPQLMLATNYWTIYDLTFTNWKKLFINEPTYQIEKKASKIKLDNVTGESTGITNKWKVTQLSNVRHFNTYVEKYCAEWIGNYKETFFEVNIMMLDENNMMAIDTSGIHEPLFKLLEKEGIKVHIVPWRTRRFWDGGLHCITLDVRRKAVKKDYFPDRGDNGIKNVFSLVNGYSYENFIVDYNKWLESK